MTFFYTILIFIFPLSLQLGIWRIFLAIGFIDNLTKINLLLMDMYRMTIIWQLGWENNHYNFIYTTLILCSWKVYCITRHAPEVSTVFTVCLCYTNYSYIISCHLILYNMKPARMLYKVSHFGNFAGYYTYLKIEDCSFCITFFWN